jgi:AraC-like DNA-binding protein
MEFALHFPKAPLDAHVESITFFAGVLPRHQREKLIPDGAIELIVDLTERSKKLYADERGETATDFRDAWISGMHRTAIIIEAQAHASNLVIRFRPGGAYAFLGHDAAALTDAVFPLEDVFGRTSLRDRVLGANSVPAKMAAAEGWLMERARHGLIRDRTVSHLLRRMENPMGLRIADLAEETGFTTRHLHALFQRWVGVSPKQYARIRRFQQVLRALARSGRIDYGFGADPLPRPDWAEVAATAGFADQSHLAHEFQAYAGITPAGYLAAYRGLENYLPIVVG